MHSSIKFILLSFVFLAIEGKPSRESNKFTTIGTIKSKTYLEPVNNPKVSWREAKTNCEEEGLEMGNAKNFDEFDYFYQKRKQNDYWISGSLKGVKDGAASDEPLGFEWADGSNIQKNTINFNHDSSKWLCLYFDGGHHTFVDICSAKHKTLCQKNN